MRGNNFGLGSRDMGKAGAFAMNREAAAGNASFSTAATIGDRFRQFAGYAKEEGLRRLEQITPETVRDYGQGLADRVAAGELSPAYAQNLLSAVNTVMTAATRGEWQAVSPTRDCGIASRSSVRDTPAASADRGLVASATAALSERGAVIADLARDFGLRSKEASLLDAGRALQEARDTGLVTVSAGTKGGLSREIPITGAHQIETLHRASLVQGHDRSLIPPAQTWAEFRNGELREIRETLQAHGMTGLHDLRAGYATERYQQITGELPPLMGGSAPRAVDLAAREQLAAELGHGRTDIIASYIGGRP